MIEDHEPGGMTSEGVKRTIVRIAEYRIQVSPTAAAILVLLGFGLVVAACFEGVKAPPPGTAPAAAPPPATPPSPSGDPPSVVPEATVDAILAAVKSMAADGERFRHLTIQLDSSHSSPDEVKRATEEAVVRADEDYEKTMAPGRAGVAEALARLPGEQVAGLVERLPWMPNEEREELLRILALCSDGRITDFCRALGTVDLLTPYEAQCLSVACTRSSSVSLDLLDALPWREDDATRGNVVSCLWYHDDLEGALRLFARMDSEGKIALHDADVLCMIGARTERERHKALVMASGCPPALRVRYLEELASGWEKRDSLLAVLEGHRSRVQSLSSR